MIEELRLILGRTYHLLNHLHQLTLCEYSPLKKLRNYPADKNENQNIHTIVCRFGVCIGA
jgi:hypothetical protein